MTDQPVARGAAPFDLSAGAVCLDYCNTVSDRGRRETDRLGSYADLLRWAEQADVVEPGQARRLARRAVRQPAPARRAFRRAVALRETLFRIFELRAMGSAPRSADLAALNRAVAASFGRLRLGIRDAQVRWSWDDDDPHLDRPLWPVLRSAAELLTGPEGVRIRQCASDHCSWLFVDRSRTRGRRWCDMKTCGNRAKARRYYERHGKRR